MMLVLSSVVECSVQKWLPGCVSHIFTLCLTGHLSGKIHQMEERKGLSDTWIDTYVFNWSIVYMHIYIHIFAFMFLYTHIFALTINTIEFLCCSIDRRIFRPQPCQQFISKVSLAGTNTSSHILLPEVFPTLGRFEKKFQICCFCFETSRTSCMDLLVFSICDPSQLLNWWVRVLLLFFIRWRVDAGETNRGNVCVVETFTGWRSLSSRLQNLWCKTVDA